MKWNRFRTGWPNTAQRADQEAILARHADAASKMSGREWPESPAIGGLK